ncbi:PqiC family protein [Oceanisphaera avium]|uniref:ABC-type transport auxiliary lipoprotein component domain-containing protein n=1 Tax=Oceanisphaera avium TaxID=1903694 RepID=A0A1Y0CV88_9GAMM|nr:ABC-type transport auxiliary lipoprotein family protein [Oceanisphaera avium]ART79253.1 hypothetical protein CBP12_03075 [Oceanisphaera avium]
MNFLALPPSWPAAGLNWKSMALGLSLLSLVGCASAPPSPTHYMLPTAAGAATVYPTQLVVKVAPIHLASHIDNEGIIMQLNDIEVYQAREHLWGQDIGQQLQQQLQQRLAKDLPNATIVSKGQTVARNMPVRELQVQVSRLQGQFSGDALIEGQWQLLDEQGQLITQQPFSVLTPLTKDGYPELVRALGKAWQQQADVLARELSRAY